MLPGGKIPQMVVRVDHHGMVEAARDARKPCRQQRQPANHAAALSSVVSGRQMLSTAGRYWDNRAVSPKSRGRPPGRGRSRRPGTGRRPTGRTQSAGGVLGWEAEESTGCWFDEPPAGDRRSWAVPPGHGTYRGLDLELLDPDDEDERGFLLEAQHPELEEALERDEEITTADGEPMNPRLHVTLHAVVANQLMADDPAETWQAVQRLAGLGYDWHNVMHMISRLVSDDLYQAMTDKRPFDREDYVRRLAELPGDWPPPSELGLR